MSHVEGTASEGAGDMSRVGDGMPEDDRSVTSVQCATPQLRDHRPELGDDLSQIRDEMSEVGDDLSPTPG